MRVAAYQLVKLGWDASGGSVLCFAALHECPEHFLIAALVAGLDFGRIRKHRVRGLHGILGFVQSLGCAGQGVEELDVNFVEFALRRVVTVAGLRILYLYSMTYLSHRI